MEYVWALFAHSQYQCSESDLHDCKFHNDVGALLILFVCECVTLDNLVDSMRSSAIIWRAPVLQKSDAGDHSAISYQLWRIMWIGIWDWLWLWLQ